MSGIVSVFVLDKKGVQLMPCTPHRARKLLGQGRAFVRHMAPFTIQLKDVEAKNCAFQPLVLKLDPGSKTTGIAIVRECEDGSMAVVSLQELVHRSRQISESLTARSNYRRRRRGNLRYREPRFLNRTKPKGWLAPSLQHRVNSTVNYCVKLMKLAPITRIAMELVRFDMQKMENPEISGIEYQQGTLQGYEVREYLLEKFGRQCAYCDAQGVPLQVEHIHPKARGGSNRISNLTLACKKCNEAKDAQDVKEFLAPNPARLANVLAQSKKPLKDAAAVNTTRWALANKLREIGLPVELASGGKTKWNRSRLGIPKTHSLDAVCVGEVAKVVKWENHPVLTVKATGRGSYCRTRVDKYGFPRGYLTRQKHIHGFKTGDMVVALVPTGKKVGTYKGKVAVRASGYFNIQQSVSASSPTGHIESPEDVSETTNLESSKLKVQNSSTVQGISYKHCRLIQRYAGYAYFTRHTNFNNRILTRKEMCD